MGEYVYSVQYMNVCVRVGSVCVWQENSVAIIHLAKMYKPTLYDTDFTVHLYTVMSEMVKLVIFFERVCLDQYIKATPTPLYVVIFCRKDLTFWNIIVLKIVFKVKCRGSIYFPRSKGTYII